MGRRNGRSIERGAVPWSRRGRHRDSGGNVGIGTSTPTQKLTVNGSVLATNIAVPSSRRLKLNVMPMGGATEAVLALEPVWFDWVAAEAKSRGFTRDFGFIAEDVQKVFPEVVFSDDSGQVLGMEILPGRLSAVSICCEELNATIEEGAHREARAGRRGVSRGERRPAVAAGAAGIEPAWPIAKEDGMNFARVLGEGARRALTGTGGWGRRGGASGRAPFR